MKRLARRVLCVALAALMAGAPGAALAQPAAAEEMAPAAAADGGAAPAGGGDQAATERGDEAAAGAAEDAGAEAAEDGAAPAGEVPANAEEKAADDAATEAERVAELCGLLVAAADAHGVPHDFFIRLIWKESRFSDGAVSPVGAQGIAQFMPGTARLRGLDNPFDRQAALFASAAFLADLKAEFGSWGLAAAAYNGGPNRIPGFVAGEASLPYETVDYVFSITGRPAEHWAARARARLARGEQPAEPAGWIGRGFSEEELAALREGRRAGATERATPGGEGEAVPAAPEVPEALADGGEPAAAAPAASAVSASAGGGGPATEASTASTNAAAVGAAAESPALPAAAGSAGGSAPAADTSSDEGAEGGVSLTAVAATGPAQPTDGAVAAVGQPAVPPSGAAAPDGATDGSDGRAIRYPPTLLALARPPFAIPVPRSRPEGAMPAVNCPELVARLGRSRSVAPPSVAGGGWTPWGAQVAGHVRRDVALRQYDRLKARLPGDLVAAGPSVVVRRFAARGRLAIHAVQFAAANRREAQALCARIARSRAPCVVVRNR
jgi:soluble lytic murein transglycosylase-like protein